ncbi:MAG: response regulator transcription factor [Erysipelotrichaceae bacterium]|jgi:DNA-binding response OmpR family regulator|nr:response regulator transcription factor [Erysipelotrichaceae bacterium]
MYNIFVVEDDPVIALKVKEHLESWDLTVTCVKDFYHVIEEFVASKADLVLMDIRLPYLNGYQWTSRIRQISSVPVIFVSSADDNMNVIMALSQGADDFITKPFELEILTAKVQALLRRTYDFAGKSLILEHKGVRFLVDENKVIYEAEDVELTKNEAKILRLLMEKKNKIVYRDTLMEYLWKTDSYVDENALSVNVNRLRKKLESIGVLNYIQTKKGQGYTIC